MPTCPVGAQATGVGYSTTADLIVTEWAVELSSRRVPMSGTHQSLLAGAGFVDFDAVETVHAPSWPPARSIDDDDG